jgi:secondary thiamine-phosphate synthase enzyme
MKAKSEKIKLSSKKQFELIDITEKVQNIISKIGLKNGIVNIFSPHTTAAVRLNHNEPLLMQDIMKMVYRAAPVDINYAHDLFEIRSKIDVFDRSNGHAHVKAFLLGSSQSIPVESGKLILGSRQSIFFVEFDGSREREVIVTAVGE